jgi:hypothetical protein
MHHDLKRVEMREHEIRKFFPSASRDTIEANLALQSSEPQHNEAPALGSAVPRRSESTPRVTVRFIGYRVRPLDPDNFAGGCKALIDGLRYAHLIEGDEPWRINLETRQEKVARRTEERTIIEIELPQMDSAESDGQVGKQQELVVDSR